MSTRVKVIVGYQAPTSNDPRFILKYIGGNKNIFPAGPALFGFETTSEVMRLLNENDPSTTALIEEYSAINHVSEDDPSAFLKYKKSPSKGLLPEYASPTLSIHSAKFGIKLKEALNPLGVECFVDYENYDSMDMELQFVIENLDLHK